MHQDLVARWETLDNPVPLEHQDSVLRDLLDLKVPLDLLVLQVLAEVSTSGTEVSLYLGKY